jgi:hypothetical protein
MSAVVAAKPGIAAMDIAVCLLSRAIRRWIGSATPAGHGSITAMDLAEE